MAEQKTIYRAVQEYKKAALLRDVLRARHKDHVNSLEPLVAELQKAEAAANRAKEAMLRTIEESNAA